MDQNFLIAFDWTMQWEDPERQYAQVPDPGGFAIAGINSNSWPSEFDLIANMPQDDRAQPVQQFYADHFWTPWLAQVASVEVSKRVYDAGVNMGSGTAARLFQQAMNANGAALEVDGQIGPLSLAYANSADPATIVAAFQQVRSYHYRNIVANNPSLARYLAGWIARAMA